MNILIDNSGYELRNFGDVAMLTATIFRIKKMAPDSKVFVFTTEPERLKDIDSDIKPIDIKGRNDWLRTWNLFGGLHKVFPRCCISFLKRIELYLKATFPSLTAKFIMYRMHSRNYDCEDMQDFLSLMMDVDITMASGGGFINDEFSTHAKNVLNTIYFAQKLKIKTAMIGQGVGPVTNLELISICRKVFPKLVFLGLRESVYSYDTVLSLGAMPANVEVTGDDAVKLAYDKKPNNIGTKVGFNLRLAKYSNLNLSAVKDMRSQLDVITESLQVELMPIAISIHDEDSDQKTLTKFLGYDIDISQFDSVNSVINNIGDCKIVITGSYHAGVFALSQGIPVICIVASDYYKQKFEGLMNQFGSEFCKVVYVDKIDQLKSLSKMALTLIESSGKNREKLYATSEKQIILSDKLMQKLITSVQ